MPGAPRFTQKPSIQQTAQGDLLMECHLEADPPPDVRWAHAGTAISPSARVTLSLENQSGNLYKAVLIIKEPNAGDGGAYKCTAKNQMGESNANINLNFAGGGEERASTPQRGPTFVGKPRIIPKDGGALILMECKVKSASKPTARWSKDGVTLNMGGLYQDVFTDLGDNTYLCQLEIRKPSAGDAGQYRCNIRNDIGETNANLSLNFQQEEAAPSDGRRSPSVNRDGKKSPRGSRPGTPSKRHKEREGTPKRHKSKSREGSPRKSVRSRTATPTQELLQPESAASTERKSSSSRTETMEVDSSSTKRKSDGAGLPPAPKKRERSRSKSPAVPQEKPTGPDAHTRAPVVSEPLKSQVARSGDTIQLECELQCHSSTKITWSKDGKTVTTSSEYSSSFDGRIARLVIRRMSETKSGLYKCLAKSDYGEAQSSAMVKYEMSEEEKEERRSSLSSRKSSLAAEKSEKEKTEETHKRKAEVAKDDQVVPEKQRASDQDGLKTSSATTPATVPTNDTTKKSSISTSRQKEETNDEVSEKITPERRKELINASGGYTTSSVADGDSEDEITESISELPSFAGKSRPSRDKKATTAEENGQPERKLSFQVGRRGSDDERSSDGEKSTETSAKKPNEALNKLQGRQVGQKRDLQPFQQIQLKRTPKEKKGDASSDQEAPELKSRRGTLEAQSRRDSSLTGRTQEDVQREFDRRDSTQLQSYSRKDSVVSFDRVYSFSPTISSRSPYLCAIMCSFGKCRLFCVVLFRFRLCTLLPVFPLCHLHFLTTDHLAKEQCGYAARIHS
jgi:hypothetical protein